MKRSKKFFLLIIVSFVMVVGLYKNFSPGNYNLLENYLAEKRWQFADRETERIILDISGRRWYGSLADLLGWENSLKNFPCSDLNNINDLWTRYSNGYFGLSIQQQIFQSLEVDNFDGDWFKLYDTFFRTVGWQYMYQKNSSPNFSLEAPRGHLPSPGWMLKAGGTEKTIPWITNGIYLYQRIEACNIEVK